MRVDLSGRIYTAYLVIGEDLSYSGKTTNKWFCLCRKCGSIKSVFRKSVTENTSCGCQQFTHKKPKRRKDILKKPTRFYKIWQSMKDRCLNPRCKGYLNYGGRGITIDLRWVSFQPFKDDMSEGYQNDLSLDRIDFNGNYEKSNCRWATKTEQSRNKRNIKLSPEIAEIIRKSPKLTAELAREFGVSWTVVGQVRKGTAWAEPGTRPVPSPDRTRTYHRHRSRLFRIWGGIIQRCHNPNSQSYHNYGAREIKVCDHWRTYRNFKADMERGYADHLTLDRIDSNSNYQPSNCRWATHAEQNRNQRSTKLTAVDAEFIRSTNHPPKFYREKFNISYSLISGIKKGQVWA